LSEQFFVFRPLVLQRELVHAPLDFATREFFWQYELDWHRRFISRYGTGGQQYRVKAKELASRTKWKIFLNANSGRRDFARIIVALEFMGRDVRESPMDVIAHGLWGGAAFYSRGWRKFLAGVLVGMAPDLLSFGLFHVMQPSWITMRLAGEISGPPALATLPPYVFHAYNITHSLVVWAASFALVGFAMGKPPWLLGAWLLHVVCDIPTHTESYFPTPFLWPFSTPFVNGIPWSTPWLMIANYASMISVYAGMFAYFHRRRTRLDGALARRA
jgi:hypothetical protein